MSFSSSHSVWVLHARCFQLWSACETKPTRRTWTTGDGPCPCTRCLFPLRVLCGGVGGQLCFPSITTYHAWTNFSNDDPEYLMKLRREVEDNDVNYLLFGLCSVSLACRHFMILLCQKPKIEELLKHPFITDGPSQHEMPFYGSDVMALRILPKSNHKLDKFRPKQLLKEWDSIINGVFVCIFQFFVRQSRNGCRQALCFRRQSSLVRCVRRRARRQASRARPANAAGGRVPVRLESLMSRRAELSSAMPR